MNEVTAQSPAVITQTRWQLPYAGFVSNLCTAILETQDAGEISDIYVVKVELFGIGLTYERILKRHDDDDDEVDFQKDQPKSFRFAIYTPTWVIESEHEAREMVFQSVDEIVWTGRGDFERWQRDAALLKLYGVAPT